MPVFAEACQGVADGVTGCSWNERSKKMKHKRIRIAIVALAAFIALSAIGGGIAMLAGAMQFPLEWLRNTPFSDYTIPALVLAMVIGGSSLLAAVTVFTGREVGVLTSLAAGLIMAGYEVVEVVTIKHVYWREARLLWAWPADLRTGCVPLDDGRSPSSGSEPPSQSRVKATGEDRKST